MANIGSALLQGDIADRDWPEGVRRRLYGFRFRADEALAATQMLMDQIAEQRERKLAAEARLRRLQHLHRDPRPPSMGGPAIYEEDATTAVLDHAARANAKLTWVFPEDEPQVAALKGVINACFQHIRRLEAVRDPRQALWNERGGFVRNVENFLNSGVTLRSFAEPTPTLRKGEDVLGALENRRRRHRELVALRHATTSAPVDAVTAKAKIKSRFEMLRATRAPSIERLLHGGDLELPILEMRATPVFQTDPPSLIAWQQVDVEGLLAYAVPGLEKLLCAAVDQELRDASPLTDAERAKRLSETDRDLLAVTREECWLVELAHEQGRTEIEYRLDTDPAAAVNAEVIATMASKLPDTSRPWSAVELR